LNSKLTEQARETDDLRTKLEDEQKSKLNILKQKSSLDVEVTQLKEKK